MQLPAAAADVAPARHDTDGGIRGSEAGSEAGLQKQHAEGHSVPCRGHGRA